MDRALKLIQSVVLNSCLKRYQALLVLESTFSIKTTSLYETFAVVLRTHQENNICRKVLSITQENKVTTFHVLPATASEVRL